MGSGWAETGGLPVDPDAETRPGRRRPRRGDVALVVAVGCGGVVGALARQLVEVAVPAPAGHFPWATFAINTSGSALLGFLLVMVVEQFPRGRLARPVLGTGVLGAYTTFSTFCVEAAQLLRGGYVAMAALYLGASLLAGLAAAAVGLAAARVVIRAERWLAEELS